jgi:hypothetical protein
MKSARVEITRKTKIQDATRVASIQLTIVEADSDQMVFLKPGSKAWAEAWKGLLTLAGCVVARSPETGDRWEYVGTYKGHHEFRHKNHPQVGDRLYARVAAESCFGAESLIWSGSPYYEEGSEVRLKKECPLKALFNSGDG